MPPYLSKNRRMGLEYPKLKLFSLRPLRAEEAQCIEVLSVRPREMVL